MFLKQRKASTDPRLRSLLQKAVRRGYVDIVDATARRLFILGDKTWLRSRAVVITFEECWPLAERLALEQGESTKIRSLVDAAIAEKQKDAAGLGSLAYAYHEGDKSVERYVDDPRSVRIVAEALSRPEEFFNWVLSQAKDDRGTRVALTAKKYLAAATWEWDKTCILAGALLACTKGVPSINFCEAPDRVIFPYWVALDKHTPEGKEALRKISTRLGATYRQIIWASFYCESAATNALSPSPWWEAERAWRLAKAGMSFDSASKLWESVRPSLQAELALQATALQSLVSPFSIRQTELLS